jgi:uncharacterized protein YkwD
MLRWLFLLFLSFLVPVTIMFTWIQPVSAHTQQTACTNIPATPDYLNSGNPRDAIGAINYARQRERIHPLQLPNNFYQLSPVQQQFKLVNAERVDRGLRPLILGTTLSQMAQSYSQQMETQHFIGHTSPDGTTFVQRINKNASVRNHYSAAAENIAANPIAGAGSIYEYMYDDAGSGCGHRATILTPQLTHIGIGVVNDMIYGTLSVQDFIASACWNPYKG